MRATKYFFCTLKKVTNNKDTISNQLMLRAGMIRQLSAGIYTWLPTGLRILKKIKNIIRQEMNKVNSIEMSIPIMQPNNLWKLSKRWEEYGLDLFRLTDRNQRCFILSPTNEEIITYIIKNEIKSYQDLPINLFQIRTKFRDELRPRFGITRSREFIMKDGYSFHDNKYSLQKTYEEMYDIYLKIFSRIGLNVKVVKADNGNIGGSISHEFQVVSKNGEDEIAFSNKSNYFSKVSSVRIKKKLKQNKQATQKLTLIKKPGVKNINDLVVKLKLPIKKIIKILVVKSNQKDTKLIALLLRADHTFNKKKIEKIPFVYKPLTIASKKEIYELIKIKSDLLGPINLNLTIVSDYCVLNMVDFIAGANIDNEYFLGINWIRDLPKPKFVYDIRNVVSGDVSPDGFGELVIKKSVEIGHIFQLGDKYSQLLQASIQNKYGNNQLINMGCYGIGITRIVSVIIEQNHDKNGIVWPSDEISPFTIAILPINIHNSLIVQKYAEDLYKKLYIKGIDVILDDRKKSFGFMLKDMELIGVSHLIVISEYNIKNNIIEYKKRGDIFYKINCKDILNFINSSILK